MRKRFLVLLLLGLGLASRGAGALDLGVVGSLKGGYKNLFFYTEDSQGTAISTDLNRLRLELQGTRSSLSWHLAYDHELLVGGLLRSPDFAVLEATRDPTFLDLDSTITQDRHHEWRHRLYRATLGWEHPYGRVLVGRQRIAWGSGRLWNPTDFFNPIDPTAIEPGEKTGVDALSMTFTRGPFGSLQLVGAPGREERSVAHKAAIRWRDTVGVTEYALLLGYIDDSIDNGIVLGADLTTNLFEGNLRFQALFSQLESGQPDARVVVGYDRRFVSALFPSGLYLVVEYFYNSAADGVILSAEIRSEPVIVPDELLPGIAAASLPTARSSLLQTRSRHLLGLSANYDLTPLLNLAGLFIIDLEKGSRFFAPRLTWSVTANIDLSATVQLFGGVSGSEFGDRNNLYLVQLEVFF
jgi:hypothetical protein